MSFLSRIRDRWIESTDALNEPAERRSLQFPDEDLLDAFSARAGYAGKRVTSQTALGLAPVWAAVSIIAEQIAQLPLKVYRQADDDGTKVEARQHRMWRILHDKPNIYTPADRFWSSVMTHLLLWGNAYIRKERDAATGVVEQLWLLPPSEVLIRWDGRDKTFEHRPTQTGTSPQFQIVGRERKYTVDDVIHIWGLSSNGVWGDSVISYCKNAFGTAMARDEFEGGFYARGAVMSGVIEHPGRVGRDGLRNLKEAGAIVYGGSDKAHQMAVFEEGATFRPMSHPLEDLQFVESRQMSATEIATMFRLPPNYLGGSTGGSLTYSTVEMNQLHFHQHTLAPWTNTIAKALSNDPAILPQGIFTCEFVMEATLRADAKTRAEFYEKMSNIGALTVDEIRALENRAALTDSEKDELKPPPPPQLENGNGNGQLPREALDAVVNQ